MRTGLIAALILLLSGLTASAQPTQTFVEFIAGFRATALAGGVSPSVYDAAMSGLTPDPRTPGLVTAQPEFTTPIWDYMDRRVTAQRIARGQAAMAQHAQLFEMARRDFGVDPYVLAAIWGVETDFGSALGNTDLIRPVVRSLATLVHQRRTRFVEDQADLIAALRLIERGDGTARTLVGSWAGAIGHLQVNPSNVLAHGRDGDGDGRVDLHNSLADALATSAAYLRALGYRPGVDWGFEVEVPQGFDWLLADRTQMRPIRFFAERGIMRVGGRQFADLDEPVFLYAPAGASGPKFLMTQNYLVFKGYNFSDSYALTLAHLTDRLKGGGPFVTSWPRNTRFPDLAERRAIQQALAGLGVYDGAIDGMLGPITASAYARVQANRGVVADGFITRDALRVLGISP